jgi:hypothetical protein
MPATMSIATMGAIAGRATGLPIDPLGTERWNDEVLKYPNLPDRPILPF